MLTLCSDDLTVEVIFFGDNDGSDGPGDRVTVNQGATAKDVNGDVKAKL